MGMIGNAPYSGLISGANIVDESIGASALKVGLLSGVKNRIINGDMKIAQRGTSFANIANAYSIDRFLYSSSHAAVVNITQNSDVPTGSGLYYSLRATIGTADTSIAAGDHSIIGQPIEGYNIADLVGVPITVSFWVRSSKTGIHCFRLNNSGLDRSYVSEYTINTANTWEKKSITIASGLITAGTWNYTNGLGLYAQWCLTAGSTYQTSSANSWVSSNSFSTANQVNCLDTVGNIFAITGVQLEKGSSATDFEFRPYSTEIDLCRRYYQIADLLYVMFPWNSGSQLVRLSHPLNPVMRIAPTCTMGTKIYGTGTMIPSDATFRNVAFAGNGTIQDVVGYNGTSFSSEF